GKRYRIVPRRVVSSPECRWKPGIHNHHESNQGAWLTPTCRDTVTISFEGEQSIWLLAMTNATRNAHTTPIARPEKLEGRPVDQMQEMLAPRADSALQRIVATRKIAGGDRRNAYPAGKKRYSVTPFADVQRMEA
ncbi:MAG: hypothetical protein V2B20_22095, partial [Pseudomonadota bacterium]